MSQVQFGIRETSERHKFAFLISDRDTRERTYGTDGKNLFTHATHQPIWVRVRSSFQAPPKPASRLLVYVRNLKKSFFLTRKNDVRSFASLRLRVYRVPLFTDLSGIAAFSFTNSLINFRSNLFCNIRCTFPAGKLVLSFLSVSFCVCREQYPFARFRQLTSNGRACSRPVTYAHTRDLSYKMLIQSAECTSMQFTAFRSISPDWRCIAICPDFGRFRSWKNHFRRFRATEESRMNSNVAD